MGAIGLGKRFVETLTVVKRSYSRAISRAFYFTQSHSRSEHISLTLSQNTFETCVSFEGAEMATNQSAAMAPCRLYSVSVIEHVAAMLQLGLLRPAHKQNAGDDEGDGGTEDDEPARQDQHLADVENPRLHLQGRGLTHEDPPRRPQLFELCMYPLRRHQLVKTMEEQKHQNHLQDVERDHRAVDAVDCLPAGFPIIAVAQVDPDHGVVP